MTAPAKSFKDMVVWQSAYALTLSVYEATQSFPKEEMYGLTSQIRRAVVSVGSNIAEGFGRSGAKEKDQFYAIAYGSLVEVEHQLLVARGIEYITQETFNKLEATLILTQKMLSGLQRANKMKGKDVYSKI